jgi:hypothetical protein
MSAVTSVRPTSTTVLQPAVGTSDRTSRPQPSSNKPQEDLSRVQNENTKPKGRNAKAEAAARKSGDREKQDPKKVGPWRIGKTIGTGSSGEYLFY